jgi:signal transduction histidine kinase/CheY-like chemotaxis protein
MSRFSTADKILLCVLLPLFAVVFSLHVREVVRTGIVQSPFFASPPSQTSGGYPGVGGPRLEHGVDRSGLQPGDLLIRVGDSDLRGIGYLGFDAIVVEEAGVAAHTSLVYERDGIRHTTDLELIPYPEPWMRVPFLLGAAIVGTIVLVSRPRKRHSRLVFLAMLSLAIFELHFFGGSRWQSYASLILFNFGGGVALWAILRWLIEFPQEVPESSRLNRRWAWLGSLFILVRLNYILGGPLPSHVVPLAVLLVDGFFLVTIVGILTWNTLHAPAVGQRRSKWVLLGAYLTAMSMLLSLVPSFIEIEGVEYFETLPYGMLMGAAFPLMLLMAIIRYDLFDIDRILSSTASYSLAVGALLAALVVAAPPIAAGVSNAAGIDEQVTLWLLAGALIVVALPFGRLVRTHFDRIVFPERRARETGFQKLFADLSECATPSETLRLLADRVRGLLEPEFVVVLVRVGDELVPLDAGASTEGSAWTLPARGVLALGLEAHPRPLSSDDGSLRRRLAQLPAEERSVLDDRGVRVVMPLRQGKDLIGVMCIGAARSGDIYTSTDRTLLGAAAEKASAELVRLADASRLEHERARSSELAALKHKAEEANLAKSRFLAAASHDLRQPLHALGLFVSHLEEKLKGEETADLVENIRDSTESLTGMFTSLLDLSRLDAGTVVPEIDDVDIARLFARLASEFEPQASQKGLSLEVETSAEWVRSDPQLLARILQNLLSNAVRYTARGGIRLEARRVGGEVEIEVADTGSGIPVEQQREVFQEFVQLDAECRGSDGVGLGLSIVDGLVRVLGHRLDLESTPGSGTCFTLTLPAAEVSQNPSAERGARTAADLRGIRVVVIDDDLAVLEGMRTTLRRWGCSVVVAATAEDALEGIAQRGVPDIILTDYRLPEGRTGVGAIDLLREQVGRPVPAAVITGETTREVSAKIAVRGLVQLTKPVAPVTLRATIAELVRPA